MVQEAHDHGATIVTLEDAGWGYVTNVSSCAGWLYRSFTCAGLVYIYLVVLVIDV